MGKCIETEKLVIARGWVEEKVMLIGTGLVLKHQSVLRLDYGDEYITPSI